MGCHVLQRFERCCERSLRSSLRLASLLSGQTVEKIEKAYKRHCEVTCPVMQMDAELEQDEAQDFELEMLEEQGEEPGCDSECMKLLTTVARETVFTDPEQYDPQELAEPEEMDLKSVSDKQELVKLLETPAAPEKSSEKNIGREYMPSSLHEALELPGDLFNSLFRLCCRLRQNHSFKQSFQVERAQDRAVECRARNA